jgi:hypothetical protein
MGQWAVTLCLLLLATATSAPAGNKSDLVVMKNGDRFTCDIKGLSSGALYISLDYAAGTISVEWSSAKAAENRRADSCQRSPRLDSHGRRLSL